MDNNYENWNLVINPERRFFNFRIKEIYSYYDLLVMFVKKEIAVQYKQTVLGPLWYFIQPIFTTIIFVFVFGNIAKISTDGLPQPLFYMCGIVIWNFFADCFIKTSDTFTQNSNLFGKVYFPRLISPLSVVISNLIKFFIQFGLFIIILIYYSTQLNFTIKITYSILFVPFLILIMGILGLGFGLIFSSLTTKYKDLKFLLQFGIQLLMYATPIIYPLKSVSKKMQEILLYNPITSVIEAFKYIFLGEGYFSVPWVLYSFFIALLILMFGVLIFNKTEQTFMDII